MNTDALHPALGIDYGEARIGIAATDPLGILAHPVETIHTARTDPLERIPELAGERHITRLVLGLPVSRNGEEGPAAAKVRQFAAALRARLPSLGIEFVDEFRTTVEAAEKLHAAGRNARRQKAVIDQAAAVEILAQWMEGHAAG